VNIYIDRDYATGLDRYPQETTNRKIHDAVVRSRQPRSGATISRSPNGGRHTHRPSDRHDLFASLYGMAQRGDAAVLS